METTAAVKKGSVATQKPHAVLVPYPAQGHVNPFMQLGKLLQARGFHITFVNNDHNHRRFIHSKGEEFIKGEPDFRFETIPDGMPRTDKDATQDGPLLCFSMRRTCMEPLKELINKLNSPSWGVPPVTCIISDGWLCSFAIAVAEQLGIPEVQFWTASAVGFLAYYWDDQLLKRGIVPFKDENFLTDGSLLAPVDYIPGTRNLQLKDMPSFIRLTSLEGENLYEFAGSEVRKSLRSSAIIINSFDQFEKEALDSIADMYPNIFPIGPLTLLTKTILPSSQCLASLWKEDTYCLEWLDKREPQSVVYVNYGCMAFISGHHFKEFAWGLARSNHPFLWIVRPDVVMGAESRVLPEGFYKEVEERGLIASWCLQEKVLEHPAIGAFLSHAGWNSTLESISGGVPMLCWPCIAEQPTNSKYACTEWGIGLEIDQDVKCDQVASLVQEMFKSQRGKQLRQKAMEWKKKALEATTVGGSSYETFDRFINKFST
ncbi:hypothetical protein Tsubulata_017714 [Turnera subulata]|uniref:Glycosyltransferase n=1 Tax=Turnera subulata TaxID=218843 RepID=A0A9Q0GB72_9ROSI|nr:hypothetical protein Tsubulata_017714 [Turnera subulata]